MVIAPNRNDQIGEQWLKLIAQQSARVPFPVGMAMIVIAIMVSQEVPKQLAFGWLGLVFLVLLLRFFLLSKLFQNTALPFAAKERRVIVMSAVNGTVHALCLLTFPVISDHEKLFITVLLLALCTAATSTTAGHRATFIAYALPVLVTMMMVWVGTEGINNQNWVERSIGLLIGFYGVILLGVAKGTYRIFVESWVIRENEHDLNQKLQAALAQAQQANSAKTRFLAAASHDLRQPLHTQSLLIATLSLRKLDTRSTEIVRLLLESNATLAKLLDGLLDISKLDAGIVESVCNQFQIQGLVTQHYLEVEAAIRAKGLVPMLVLEANVFVNTDSQLLLRILRNLTDNAIKFTERGQIQLSVKADHNFVYVSVADTGRGILAQHHDKIFQEFYQVENAERDRAMGLGLGLSIVKRLTDLLDIGLTFTSVMNSGTQFTLRLPIVCNPCQLTQAVQTPAADAQAFALNILIVDDEKAVRTSMRILLEELGCRCFEAGGTAEAVMVTQQNQPDFILVDFRLRGEDSGIATINAIKNRWPGTPALLVSGDTAPDRQREAYLAGIRLLHKPLLLEQLKLELNEVRQNRERIRNNYNQGV